MFTCDTCHHHEPRWRPRCPRCQAWNAFVRQEPTGQRLDEGVVPAVFTKRPSTSLQIGREMEALRKRARESGEIVYEDGDSVFTRAPTMGRRSVAMSSVPEEDIERIETGIEPLDRVLGGGIPPHSVILLTGDPGVGKTTLLIQAAVAIAGVVGRQGLYVTGEQTEAQVVGMARSRSRAESDAVAIMAEQDLAAIFEEARLIRPSVVIVDSIQTTMLDGLSAGSSVSAMKEIVAQLCAFTKSEEGPEVMWLIGHVNKGGVVAGPRLLSHLVDCCLHFAADKVIDRATGKEKIVGDARHLYVDGKSRLGGVGEQGEFLMLPEGLVVNDEARRRA